MFCLFIVYFFIFNLNKKGRELLAWIADTDPHIHPDAVCLYWSVFNEVVRDETRLMLISSILNEA